MALMNAKKAVESGTYQHFLAEKQMPSKKSAFTNECDYEKCDKRDERRRKATSGKSGGGSQGRETKMKAIKKHKGTRNQSLHSDNSDEEDAKLNNKKLQNTLELVKKSDIENVIKKTLVDEGLLHILEPFCNLYQK